MKDIVLVLQGLSELALWTRIPHEDALPEEQATPPVVTWRYRHPSRDLATFLRRVVGSFPGEIAWTFSAAGDTWSLVPARVRDHARAPDCPGMLSAITALKTAEPDFGTQVNRELRLLAEHIQQQMRTVRRA